MSQTSVEKEYALVLAALFHDVGKAFLRLHHGKGFDKVVELFDGVFEGKGELFTKCLESMGDIRHLRHEDYSICVMRLFKLYLDKNTLLYGLLDQAESLLYELKRGGAKSILADIIGYADFVTASERSVSEEKEVYEPLSRIHELVHSEAPFASPLWLYYLYRKGEYFNKFIEYLEEYAERKDEKILERVRKLFLEAGVLGLSSKPFYIEPRVIKWSEMKQWKINYPKDKKEVEINVPYSFKPLEEAKGKVDYEEVVREFLKSSRRLLDLVKEGVMSVKGFVETMLAVMKRVFLFVPAGVYGSILPDTSLYAHTKAVTAIAHASKAAHGFRLLVVDINGIQEFIRTIAQHKAASRVLRGKSLLVELLQRAIASYILDVFGLTWANVIGYEGGVITIIIPADISIAELERLAARIEEKVLREFHGEIGVTIAWSPVIDKPITLKQVFALAKGEISGLGNGTYARGLVELHKRLLERRYRKRYYYKNYNNEASLKSRQEYFFDRLTHTPVFKDEYISVNVDPVYFNEELAPEAFTISGVESYYSPRRDNVVSHLTHKALVAGATSRNLVAIIHLKAKEDSYNSVLGGLVDALNNITGKSGGHRRYWRITDSNLRIGIIDFKEFNQVFILVASEARNTGNPWGTVYSFAHTLAGTPLSKDILGNLDEVKIVFVNALDKITEWSGIEYEALRSLGGPGILSLDYWFTNTMHPSSVEEGIARLMELDGLVEGASSKLGVIGLLAVGKMDGDRLGEIVRMLSASPSRFITVSELLQFYFGGLSYALLEEKVGKIWQVEKGELRYGDAIVVLFGGGDDIAVYGHWLPLIEYLLLLRRGMDQVLYPLTASAGVAADYYKVPIAMLYSDALRLLEVAKSEGRNRITLFDDSLPHIEEYDEHTFTVKSVKYSTSYDKILETIAEASRAKNTLQVGDVYTLYQIAVKISDLLRRQQASKTPQPESYNEIALNAIRLQYDYYRVMRNKKSLEEINTIREIMERLGENKPIHAILETNKKLPILSLITRTLRKPIQQ